MEQLRGGFCRIQRKASDPTKGSQSGAKQTPIQRYSATMDGIEVS